MDDDPRIVVSCTDEVTQELLSQVIRRSKGLHFLITTEKVALRTSAWESFLSKLEPDDAGIVEELIGQNKLLVAPEELQDLLTKFTEKLNRGGVG